MIGTEHPELTSAFVLIRDAARPYRGRLLIAALFCLVAVALELVPYAVVWLLISKILAGTAVAMDFLQSAGVIFLALLFGTLSNGFALAQSHIAAFDTLRTIRHAVSQHLTKLPLGRLRSIRSGEAKDLIVSEPEKQELLIAHAVPEGLSALVLWSAVSIWLVAIDWVLALACILPTLASFALMARAMSATASLSAEYQTRLTEMNTAIVELANGMPTLKTMGSATPHRGRANDAARQFSKVATQMGARYLPLGSVFFALIAANLCFILPVGLWQLQADAIDLNVFTLFIVLGPFYSTPLLRLFNLMHHMNHVAMGAQRLLKTLNLPVQAEAKQQVAFENYDIVFDAVRFDYEDRAILPDVSLTVPTGTMAALVGPSGAGKSTLAGLVARFQDVSEGRVTIGGHDLRDIPTAQLMETVSFVFQDTFLFADSIANNLRMARPNASNAELRRALQSAQALEFVDMLPRGIETPVGNGGETLSGGESQRLTIARAILKDAPVLILDEATAATDPTCEAKVQMALKHLSQGRTVIVIAHRLHTITGADQIHVIESGRVTAKGSHDDLLAKPGCYRNMWADYEAIKEAAQ